MTDRDFLKELADMQAVGKVYKTRDGRRAVCVGDFRLGLQGLNFPLTFVVDGHHFSTASSGCNSLDGITHYLDVVGVWEEPKPKVRRARALLLMNTSIPYATSELFKNREEIVTYYGNPQILMFPYGEWEEFDV